MEPKKNPKIDINRQRNLFFGIGLIVSLIFVIVAFEWKSYESLESIELEGLESEEIPILEIPITEMTPPPPPPPQVQSPEIVEVPDDEEVQEQVEMELELDVEVTSDPSPVVSETPIKVDGPPPAPPKGNEDSDEIFMVVEQPASPIGGMQAFYKYVQENLKYPKQARRAGIEGKVIIQMTVEKNGELTDFKVLKGIGAGCDEEAIRILKGSPKWNPGKQRGRPVRSKLTLPLNFQLGE